MNKTAVKNFAIWARNKLIAEIKYKASLLGVTEKEIKKPLPQSTPAVQFFDIGTREPYTITGDEIEQRKRLVEEIGRRTGQSDHETAYMNLVEEVAYTWFNRLIAVRFMEVNDYLPTHIRVLSSESSNKAEPDLVTNPFDADLVYTPYEKDRIRQLKLDNRLDELFRMLFIKQCNALNSILPDLFEKTNDYSELLLNVSFTDKEGVVHHLVNDISEEDFQEAVEIIGWLYQYYNTEPKDETFALLKKSIKITKERIPAVTQLFTPDWIVRYMVENSLGRLWIEGHTNDDLKSKWKYYLDEVEQEVDVQAQLAKIREEYKAIRPEDIKLVDPCMGSGHILVYAFDVLMQIYEGCGYSQRDAASSIITNNLYGLDIDDRAYQLAYFAVMMKARQYNRRILGGETKCNLYAIQESNGINRAQLKYFGQGMSELERNVVLPQMEYLLDTLRDAKEYGSIISVEPLDWALLREFVNSAEFYGQMTLDAIGLEDTQVRLQQLVEIAAVMAEKYDVVVTNPPYMGASGMGAKLSEFVKKQFPDTKSDMSTVFMEKTIGMCKKNGIMAMINIPVWMFLSSYEKLRESLLSSNSFLNMIHFGRGVFGSDFGTTAFIVSKNKLDGYRAIYRKLYLKQGAVDSVEEKEEMFFNGTGYHIAQQENFFKVPGMPIAYWVSKEIIRAFQVGKPLSAIALPKQGIATTDNNRFVRFWSEVSFYKIGFGLTSQMAIESHYKWFPFNKGGEFRKWYGNRDYLVNYQDDGVEIKTNVLKKYPYLKTPDFVVKNSQYYFEPCISWSKVSSGPAAFRYFEQGFIFSDAGMAIIFLDSISKNFVFGFLNSKLCLCILGALSPTVNCEAGHIEKLPILMDKANNENINHLVEQNVSISKVDWDSFETSWDFKMHPLIKYRLDDTVKSVKLSDCFIKWERQAIMQFNTLKANEEEINRVFINIYGLQHEFTPEIEDKDVTIRTADLGRDIRSFISYAVGCMFGRYSFDVDGLVYAGGEWDYSKYTTFTPDKDNILPITDEEYFEDDAVGFFCAFLKKTFGAETLEENLHFIAKALGNKGNSSREVIRNYFLKDFFKDHFKIYQKRPIYWLFDSGKADGFKALIYMHRYDADTIGKLRIDYLHRMQRAYESEIARMQETIDNSKDAREVAAATKRKEKLVKQLKECREYDEKIAHLALARIAIDLDDGVAVNYEKVQTDTDGRKLEVLAQI